MRAYLAPVLFVLFTLALAIGFFVAMRSPSARTPLPSPALPTVVGGEGHRVQVTLARDEESRSRGLSGRESLPDGEGMLFVFDRPDTYPFWMPKMRFSIDILWIDDAHRIVTIKENATPESYPELFRPSAPARYVLEIPAFAAARYGWKEGTVLSFE